MVARAHVVEVHFFRVKVFYGFGFVFVGLNLDAAMLVIGNLIVGVACGMLGYELGVVGA